MRGAYVSEWDQDHASSSCRHAWEEVVPISSAKVSNRAPMGREWRGERVEMSASEVTTSRSDYLSVSEVAGAYLLGFLSTFARIRQQRDWRQRAREMTELTLSFWPPGGPPGRDAP